MRNPRATQPALACLVGTVSLAVLAEVAGEFSVFPEVKSPPLVPEEIDQETSLPAEEVAIEEVACETTMVERVTVSEHYLAVEYVPVRPPERRMKPREMVT